MTDDFEGEDEEDEKESEKEKKEEEGEQDLGDVGDEHDSSEEEMVRERGKAEDAPPTLLERGSPSLTSCE